MMKQAQVTVASTLIFLIIASSTALAVSQPVAEPPVVNLYPGKSSVVNLAYLSDKNFSTYLQFSTSGDGYQLISFEPTAYLKANGTYYLRVNISVPQSFPYNLYFRPKIKVTEIKPLKTTVDQTVTGEIVDEREREVYIVVNQSSTSSASENQINSGPSSSLSEATSSSTSGESEVSGVSNISLVRNETSENISLVTNTMTNVINTVSVRDVSNNRSQVDFVIDQETSVKQKKPPVEKIVGKPSLRDERKIEEIVKAVAINDLRLEASSRQKDSHKHEINLTKDKPIKPVEANIEKIDLDFSFPTSDVKVVVDTLLIEGETNPSGVVTAPVILRGDEEVVEKKINVSGNIVPDIQQKVVDEEIVGRTAVGEVVRKITKKKAYKYLEIDLEGADKSRINKSTIHFSVEKSWMSDNKFVPSQIRLNRLVGDKWVELPTSLSGEDSLSYKFTSESPGFSFFVITAAITADVTTPVSVEVPTVPAESVRDSDIVEDLVGTSKPQPVLILNISWIVVVIGLGIIVLWKWNDIKHAMGFVHAKENRIRELESEKSKYERMKDETTKKFYKRLISEDEFKNLSMEYDRNIIRIDTELADIKGQKPAEKNPEKSDNK
jgi:PGF-pre-PGF domain-containing protein